MANTINWVQPATGAVSPTAAQVTNLDRLVVDVTTDGVTTTQVLTHNKGVSAADLALGLPTVTFEPESLHCFDTLQLFLNPATGKTANTVVLTFTAIAAQFKIHVDFQHSLTRG